MSSRQPLQLRKESVRLALTPRGDAGRGGVYTSWRGSLCAFDTPRTLLLLGHVL